MKRLFLLPIMAILSTSCIAITPTTSFRAGNCSFDLQKSASWQVSKEQDDRAVVTYHYLVGNNKKTSSLEISCSDLSYEIYIKNSYDKSNGKFVFLTGSGNSVTKKTNGINWSGLETEYYQGSMCLNVIGKANANHAFIVDICDEDTSLKQQLPLIRQIIRSLRTK